MKTPNIFYHGTKLSTWKKIQKEGILFGIHPGAYRYTYLTPDLSCAEGYGDVVLEVHYTPVGNNILLNGKVQDNYGFNPPPGETCWQFSVFFPISLDNVRVIKECARRKHMKRRAHLTTQQGMPETQDIKD